MDGEVCEERLTSGVDLRHLVSDSLGLRLGKHRVPAVDVTTALVADANGCEGNDMLTSFW